jgi:hypothetical protein
MAAAQLEYDEFYCCTFARLGRVRAPRGPVMGRMPWRSRRKTYKKHF